MQVHKILHGIFYKNLNFQFVQPNFRHWSLALQCYAARVVKAFPRNDEYYGMLCRSHTAYHTSEDNIKSEDNILAYINNQFEFIRKTIGPIFSNKNAAANDSNKVSKEKLVDL